METNQRKIEVTVFPVRNTRKKVGVKTELVHIRRRQRQGMSHVTSPLDGLSVKVDNLQVVEQMVLPGELALIEAFLPELVELLVNLQEVEE